MNVVENYFKVREKTFCSETKHKHLAAKEENKGEWTAFFFRFRNTRTNDEQDTMMTNARFESRMHDAMRSILEMDGDRAVQKKNKWRSFYRRGGEKEPANMAHLVHYYWEYVHIFIIEIVKNRKYVRDAAFFICRMESLQIIFVCLRLERIQCVKYLTFYNST